MWKENIHMPRAAAAARSAAAEAAAVEGKDHGCACCCRQQAAQGRSNVGQQNGCLEHPTDRRREGLTASLACCEGLLLLLQCLHAMSWHVDNLNRAACFVCMCRHITVRRVQTACVSGTVCQAGPARCQAGTGTAWTTVFLHPFFSYLALSFLAHSLNSSLASLADVTQSFLADVPGTLCGGDKATCCKGDVDGYSRECCCRTAGDMQLPMQWSLGTLAQLACVLQQDLTLGSWVEPESNLGSMLLLLHSRGD